MIETLKPENEKSNLRAVSPLFFCTEDPREKLWPQTNQVPLTEREREIIESPTKKKRKTTPQSNEMPRERETTFCLGERKKREKKREGC